MKILTAPLGEVATIERNALSPEAIESGTLYVGLENVVNDGSFVDVRPVESGELASSKFTFSKSHILFGKLRPYLRKTARPGFDGICSTDILPILPGPKVDRSYLYHYLRTSTIVNLATTRSSGANLPRLSPKTLAEFEIPLPPLEEQRRIAEVLDRADALRQKRRLAIQKLDTLLQSVFLEMFGDPVTNAKRLPTKPISWFGDVVTGNTPSRVREDYFNGNLEWIKSDNINTPSHFLTRANETLSENGRIVGRVAPKNSILVTCIAGTPACIGNAAIADREVAFNQQINAIVPNSNCDYRFFYIHCLVGKRLIQQASTNSMKGMVSKGNFEKVVFLAPNKNDQLRFGNFFDSIMLLFGKLNTSRSVAETIFSSLQQRAFKGELF